MELKRKAVVLLPVIPGIAIARKRKLEKAQITLEVLRRRLH